MPSINFVRATSHVVNVGLLWRRERCARTTPSLTPLSAHRSMQCTSSDQDIACVPTTHIVANTPTATPHIHVLQKERYNSAPHHRVRAWHITPLYGGDKSGPCGSPHMRTHPHTPCGCNFELALPKSVAGHRLHKVRAPQVPCVPRAQRFHQGRDYIATANPPPSRQTTPSSCAAVSGTIEGSEIQKLQTIIN